MKILTWIPLQPQWRRRLATYKSYCEGRSAYRDCRQHQHIWSVLCHQWYRDSVPNTTQLHQWDKSHGQSFLTFQISQLMWNLDWDRLILRSYETEHTGIHQKMWSIAFWKRLLGQFTNLMPTPNAERLHSVALALISRHPFLREPGSPDGCSGWKHCLKFKMGNFRSKLKRAGCKEVAINAGEGGGPQMAVKGCKRHRRYEVNYLPDIPEWQSEDSLEA